MQKLHYAIFALLMQYTMQQHIFAIPLHIYKKNAKKMQLCGIYDAIEFPRERLNTESESNTYKTITCKKF